MDKPNHLKVGFSGEPFTEDEMKEMLGTCVYDDSSNIVQYREFVSLLAVEET